MFPKAQRVQTIASLTRLPALAAGEWSLLQLHFNLNHRMPTSTDENASGGSGESTTGLRGFAQPVFNSYWTNRTETRPMKLGFEEQEIATPIRRLRVY